MVNMYQCTKVFSADKLTGHPFSIGIDTPDETTYIRAETREDKDNWYVTLIEYPEINKEAERQKKKKRGVFPMLEKVIGLIHNPSSLPEGAIIAYPVKKYQEMHGNVNCNYLFGKKSIILN
nr:myosin phosphatase Rho-interacting protein-like [Lytechinus pictus]